MNIQDGDGAQTVTVVVSIDVVVIVLVVVSVKVRSDEDASAFLDVVALITDDASELIVVAKESETIDGMFSER